MNLLRRVKIDPDAKVLRNLRVRLIRRKELAYRTVPVRVDELERLLEMAARDFTKREGFADA